MIESKFLTSYRDVRGEVYPSWKSKNEQVQFVEDRFSRSTRGVVRGMHGDAKTWKLCTCVYGQLALIVWDVRESKKYNFTLDDDKKLQVLIPPFCLNGHQCISEECVLHYKWSHPYSSPEEQWTVKYDDETISPHWPLHPSLLSDRAKNGKSLHELLKELNDDA